MSSFVSSIILTPHSFRVSSSSSERGSENGIDVELKSQPFDDYSFLVMLKCENEDNYLVQMMSSEFIESSYENVSIGGI